ncbi:MAG: CPBP family intramembrane metalloprotease [Clostridia bacterium]|nr:CPBP family intramembrane metalloprotease [Clostridia bacterium]
MKKIISALAKAICYTLLFVVGQIFAAFVSAAAYAVWASIGPFNAQGVSPDFDLLLQATMDFTLRYATMIGTAGGACALFVLWAFFRIRGKRLAVETGWRPNGARQNLRAALCGACCAFAVCAAMQMLPIPESMLQSYEEASAEALGAYHPLIFACTVFLAPVMEEVIFRGLVYTRLRQAMPQWIAMLLSALLFGLMHGDPLWIAYAFLLGCVMAFIYEKSGSLWGSILFHGVFNLFGSYVPIPLEGASAAGIALLAISLLGGAVLLWRMRAAAKTPCVSTEA